MESLNFLTPVYFIFLVVAGGALLLLAAALLLKVFFRPRRSKHSHYRLFGPDLVWLPFLLLIVLMTIALAGPEAKRGFTLSTTGSVDLILVVDDSFSTSATDVKLSRLELVKKEILRLLVSAVWQKGDRFTLFTFAKNSNWRMPFSEDADELRAKLAEISHPKVYTEESQLTTDLSAVLEHIPEAMDKADNSGLHRRLGLENSPGNRIVFLFTDGDDQVKKSFNHSLQELKKRKIKVYAVGVGTKAGQMVKIKVSTPVQPYYDDETEELLGYFGGAEEELAVRTALQTENLIKIANFTGGDWFVLDSEQNYLQNFLENAVNANRSAAFRLIHSNKSRNIWWEVLAIPAIVLLFLAVFLI